MDFDAAIKAVRVESQLKIAALEKAQREHEQKAGNVRMAHLYDFVCGSAGSQRITAWLYLNPDEKFTVGELGAVCGLVPGVVSIELPVRFRPYYGVKGKPNKNGGFYVPKSDVRDPSPYGLAYATKRELLVADGQTHGKYVTERFTEATARIKCLRGCA